MTEFAQGGYIEGPSVLVRFDPKREAVITAEQARRYTQSILDALNKRDEEDRP